MVITYKSSRHPRTKKRRTKKLFFATWKVRLAPAGVREAYRLRFGIATSYRQLNGSRSRTSSRDPLDRFLLVGLSLFLRNVWQWLVTAAVRRGPKKCAPGSKPGPWRYRDVLDAFVDRLWRSTQTPNGPIPIS